MNPRVTVGPTRCLECLQPRTAHASDCASHSFASEFTPAELAEGQRLTIMTMVEQLDAQTQELARTREQLRACRQVLTQALMDDSRIRGRAAVAEATIRELQEKDPTYAVPTEVMDLLEVLR